MELGSVTLKRIGFFCFPIKHSTHTMTLQTCARKPGTYSLKLDLLTRSRGRNSCAMKVARKSCHRGSGSLLAAEAAWTVCMCACRPCVRAGADPDAACSCDEAWLWLEDGATYSNSLLSEDLTVSTCDVAWLLDECLRGLRRNCTATGFLAGLRCSSNSQHSWCASG